MIRRLTDPERFRTTYYGARRYIDPLPADDLWSPTGDKERLVNCTSIAKEVGSQSFFKKVGDSRVPLDALRVADYALDAWDRLAEMPADERRHALATAATRDLNRAADRGTAVHALIEALLRGETPMLLEAEAEQYADIAEQVAKEFDGIFTHQEVVAFSRDSDHTDYAGTFDAWHADGAVVADWKTRGPDSQHGCYEKEVAQLGLAQLTGYWIAGDQNGEPVRVATPTFQRMQVVSIRPDSFEVFDVDPELAVEVAHHALAIHDHRRSGASTARAATSTPRHSAGSSAEVNPSAGKSPETPPPSVSGDRPVPSSHPSPGAAPGPATPAQLDWFERRYEALKSVCDLSLIQTRWAAAGLEHGPKKVAEMDGAEFHTAITVLDALEAEAGIPFSDPDPETPERTPRRTAATELQPEPLRIPGGDGQDVEPAEVQSLRKHLGALGDSERGNVERWMREGHRAKRPWWQPGADTVCARYFECARAAIAMAGQTNTNDDEIARAWIALVIGDEQCQTHPPGALLGTLSLDEARTLADLAARDNFAAALAATA